MKKYILLILILFSIPQFVSAAEQTKDDCYTHGYDDGCKDTACSLLARWAEFELNMYKECGKHPTLYSQEETTEHFMCYLRLEKEAEKYCDGK